MAQTDIIEGRQYIGLPEEGRCTKSGEGSLEDSQLYNSLELVYPKMVIRHFEWYRLSNGDGIERKVVESMVNSGFPLKGAGSWLKQRIAMEQIKLLCYMDYFWGELGGYTVKKFLKPLVDPTVQSRQRRD